ncbi:hypothetical protein A0H81_01971 [Grifola frondosa]|uniref:DUF6534 domain-containing protein n=1 Tax=Grifola frondosa TaxID=5627 RepID=A0A1C7ML14_GRIFR|nr:hypothetical protein A0H81_01971 [Grifola frondosa]
MASPITLDNTLGAALLGNIAAAAFYGVTNVQTYIYFSRYETDPLAMKSLIYARSSSYDNVHIALITHAVYTYTVKDFTNLLAISVPTWSILAHVIVTGVSDVIVRCIFCHRVWRLSNRNWILSAAISLNLVNFTGIHQVVLPHILPRQIRRRKSCLCYQRLQHTNVLQSFRNLMDLRRTGFARTDSIVRILMMYSVNTGALTSLCALLCLVTYANMPNNFVFIAFYFVLPKLFLNSLLATLNARRKLRETSSGALVSIPLSAASGSHMSSAGVGLDIVRRMRTSFCRSRFRGLLT